MIRINLLPFRSDRRKENIRRQVSYFLLSIVLIIVMLYGLTTLVDKRIATLREDTRQVELQIKKYKEKAHRVMQIKKDLKALKEKLVIVKSLKTQRDKQLVLFDSMTGFIVPGRMWLDTLRVNNANVTIKGIAFDNPTIADFMNNLEESSLFDKVDLKTSQMKKITEESILKSFELTCKKSLSEEEKQQLAQAAEKKGKKKKGRK